MKTIDCYWIWATPQHLSLRAKANDAEIAVAWTRGVGQKSWYYWANPDIVSRGGSLSLNGAIRRAEKQLRSNFTAWRFRVFNRDAPLRRKPRKPRKTGLQPPLDR